MVAVIRNGNRPPCCRRRAKRADRIEIASLEKGLVGIIIVLVPQVTFDPGIELPVLPFQRLQLHGPDAGSEHAESERRFQLHVDPRLPVQTRKPL